MDLLSCIKSSISKAVELIEEVKAEGGSFAPYAGGAAAVRAASCAYAAMGYFPHSAAV